MSFGRPPTLWCVLIFAAAPSTPSAALDHVRVGRALTMKSTWPSLSASASKTRMNVSPRCVRFSSGSVTPASCVEEAVGGVDVDERDAQVALEGLDDPLRLLAAQRPLSTKMQVSWSPIGAVHERRRDGGVDAAGERADHPAVADLLADAVDASRR